MACFGTGGMVTGGKGGVHGGSIGIRDASVSGGGHGVGYGSGRWVDGGSIKSVMVLVAFSLNREIRIR